MTNQQGAPEALFYADALDRCAEVDFDHIFVPAAAVIRHLHAENERLAALVEAQQPAPSAAVAPEGGPPGSGGWQKHAIEMERQRDYYRQRCHTMEEHQNGGVWYWQGDDGDSLESMGNSMLVVIRADQLRALIAAPQPSPTPQADSQPEPVHGDLLPPVGSRVFIRHGRDDDAHACTVTGYYAWGDLHGDKRLHRVFVRMVYEGTSIEQARMLCDCYPTAGAALAAVPRPSTTAPADSQPAQFVDQNSENLSDKAACASPVIDKPAPVLDRDRIREIFMAHGFTVKEGQTDLKQYVYDAADALLRAARAPADSVTAPAGGGVVAPSEPTSSMYRAAQMILLPTGDDDGGSIMLNTSQVRALWQAMLAAAPTQPAQAADSVLEDAARYRWLREKPGTDLRYGSEQYTRVCAVCQNYGEDLDAAIDAARKQGANHD